LFDIGKLLWQTKRKNIKQNKYTRVQEPKIKYKYASQEF